jgi:hypothetical protein
MSMVHTWLQAAIILLFAPMHLEDSTTTGTNH